MTCLSRKVNKQTDGADFLDCMDLYGGQRMQFYLLVVPPNLENLSSEAVDWADYY